MSKKINILISAVGGPTALGILEGLMKSKNIILYGTSLDNNVPRKNEYEKIYTVSKVTEKERYIEEIKTIIATNNIDVFFPTLQDEISLFYNQEDVLQTKIALPKSNNYEALVNKEKLYELLQANNASDYIPNYYFFNDNKELKKIIESDFNNENVFIKDASGHGGIGALKLVSKKEEFLKSIKLNNTNVYYWKDYIKTDIENPRLVMDYLEGEEYSVDIYAKNGNVHVSVPRKRTRVSNGIVIEGSIEKNNQIIKASHKISKILAISGFYNLQFIKSDKSISLIDLNARFCGSQVMSLGANVNFPLLNCEDYLNNYLPDIEPKWNTKMIRYWESYFYYD